LCGLWKQEEGAEEMKKKWDVTDFPVWKWLNVEGKRAKYKEEIVSLRQQLNTEVAEHKVS
jgi:hypothetical protein